MGIHSQHADNLARPNFTVVNKMMVSSRYVKLPNVGSLGQTPNVDKRQLGELREDWIEILVDAGKPLTDPRQRIHEFTHINI